MHQDEAVIGTNDDATGCKRSAVDRGYWEDPYIKFFVTKGGERKPPEINRGYYARVTAMKYLLFQFLEKTQSKCQVINLGAGFDTLFWNLKDKSISPTRYIEVDFPNVTSRKCHYLKTKKPLLDKLQEQGSEVQISKDSIHSHTYHLIGCDLRNLNMLEEKLAECQIDKSLPTVLLAECVLVYLSGESSNNLLAWISQTFQTALFINYEQVNMTDRFGQIMIENLKARHCTLVGVDHCKDLQSQKQRFLSSGWTGAKAVSMNDAYHLIDQGDVRRIEALEFLDETEILTQLLEHYCVCWAYKDSSDLKLVQIGFTPG